MRLRWAVAAAAFLSLGACDQIGDELAGARTRCASAQADAAQRVEACTTLIDSGKLEDNERASALANRGGAHQQAGDVTPALRDFEAALTADRDNSEALLGRAQILVESGQLDAANPLLDRLISANQHVEQAHLLKGRISLASGSYAQAVQSFDAALAIDAHDAAALAFRGRAKEEMGIQDGALADYSAAISADGNRADARAWRCWMQLKDEDKASAARADAEAAVRANGGNAQGRTCLGILQLRAEQWTDARANFDAALQVEPGNPVALFGRGVARRRSGDGDGSDDMNQAHDFNPHIRELFTDMHVRTY